MLLRINSVYEPYWYFPASNHLCTLTCHIIMVSAGEPKKVSKKIVAPVFSFARRKTGPQGIQDTFVNPKRTIGG